jgi:ATP-dependent protease HslVU (ClpYQ) peptidase subunit
MTVIAATLVDGVLRMASESRIAYGGTTYRDDATKLFRLGDAIVGMTGTVHYDRSMMNAPHYKDGEDVVLYGYTLYDYWRAHDANMRMRKDKDTLGINAIIGTRTCIVELNADGSVIPVTRGWYAIGSGGPEARGALFATGGTNPIIGVRAAIALNSGCGGQIQTMMLGPVQDKDRAG